jgi:hypothetical protein
MLLVPDDDESKRRQNARLVLWLIAAVLALLLAFVVYTSLTAPDPDAQADRVSPSD